MKRIGIILVIGVLLLSGCAVKQQAEETVPVARNLSEAQESIGVTDGKQVNESKEASDPASEHKVESKTESSSQAVESSNLEIVEAEETTKAREEAEPDYEETSAKKNVSEERSTESSGEETVEEARTESVEESESEIAKESREESAEESSEKTAAELTEDAEESENEAIPESESEEPIEEQTEEMSEATEEPVAEEPFDIGYWISYAKQCAVDHGLQLDSSATDCWDNPITANASCIYLERDLNARMSRYASMEDVTDVWIWYEDLGNGRYLIYIGYA